MTEADKPTWTELTFTCSQCHRLCRVSVEALAAQIAQFKGSEFDLTIRQIVAGIEFCLECVAGEKVPGEVIRQAPRFRFGDRVILEDDAVAVLLDHGVWVEEGLNTYRYTARKFGAAGDMDVFETRIKMLDGAKGGETR